MITYSNPRTKAIIEDWPIGCGKRGTAIFKIEQNRKGQRCTRETEKRNGLWGKPKLGTYNDVTRIVDGDDGKTYIMSHHRGYRQISVMQGNMKFSQESFHNADERYQELVYLISE